MSVWAKFWWFLCLARLWYSWSTTAEISYFVVFQLFRELLLIQEQSQSQVSVQKNEHVFLLLVSSYIFLFILSILLLISYMIYILYIRRDIRKTWLRFYNWDWDLRLHMITRFSISSLQGKRLQGAPQQLQESNVFYVAVKSRKRQR